MTYNDLIVLIPSHSLEDFPTEMGEKPAASLLNAFAAVFHPQLLASKGVLPRWQRADDPLPARPQGLYFVPLPSQELVSPGWIEEARAGGNIVIAGEHDRDVLLEQALAPLGGQAEIDPDLVADFLAFGSLYLQTELLTRQMRNESHINELQLQRELLSAARSAVGNDAEATRKHLRECFEMLLECRERFYPVDCFLLDLCLLSAETSAEEFSRLLSTGAPINFLATAGDWETLCNSTPSLRAQLAAAIERQEVELLGGDDRELPGTLMSLDSTIFHLKRGREILRSEFSAAPVTWARKRFGLGPHLPQILSRSGYRGALHIALDDGIYPDEEYTQLRWEGTGAAALNAFSRIPLAADSASGWLRFSRRMSESMDYDQTAAVALARWPRLRNPFLEDFRRAHCYAPVLGRFITFQEFFSRADTPGRRSDFKASGYLSPGLVHAVAREEAAPIGRWLRYWTLRREFERADWLQSLASLLAPSAARGEDSGASLATRLEEVVETAHPESDTEQQKAAQSAIAHAEEAASMQLVRGLTQGGSSGEGVLIVNSRSFPRRCLVEWPAPGVPPEHPSVLQRQIGNEQSFALVELPPAGFLWLPSEPHPGENSSAGKLPLAEELTLRTDLFEVQINEATGGIGQVLTYRRSPNRISQQVAYRFPHEKSVTVTRDGETQSIRTWYTAMQMREWRILSDGPLIGEIETQGDLLDEQEGTLVARYIQRTRVCRLRPVVEIELEVEPVRPVSGDPWTNYIACRFAWKHDSAVLTASLQEGAQEITNPRIEAPHYIEVGDDPYRTTLVTPGLPFHRKTGERMLDTLLIVEGESRRKFQFAIVIDSPYPLQAALDQYSPPLVVGTSSRPAGTGQSGWFFSLNVSNVQLTRLIPSGEGTMIVRLLETEGRKRQAQLQCFRVPQRARQVDFQGQTISTLRIQNEAVLVEVLPHEICDIELTF